MLWNSIETANCTIYLKSGEILSCGSDLLQGQKTNMVLKNKKGLCLLIAIHKIIVIYTTDIFKLSLPSLILYYYNSKCIY